MNKTRIISGIAILFILVMQLQSVFTGPKPFVKKVESGKINLQKGGEAVTIKISGLRLNKVKTVALGKFLKKKFVKLKNVKANILKKRNNSQLLIEFNAMPNAPLGRNYALRLMGKTVKKKTPYSDVPSKLFKLSIVPLVVSKTSSSKKVASSSNTSELRTKTPSRMTNKTFMKSPVDVKINSFNRKKLLLKNDNRAAIIVVDGRNLDQVTSVQVLVNNRVEKNIKATLEAIKGNSGTLKITAPDNARTGKNYKLRFLYKKKRVDIPLSKFNLSVDPSNKSTRTSRANVLDTSRNKRLTGSNSFKKTGTTSPLTQRTTPISPAKVKINSFSKNKLLLKNNNRTGRIVVDGINLDQITSVQVIVNNRVENNIEATFENIKDGSGTLKITALDRASVGENYKLRFIYKKTAIDVPLSDFSLNIDRSDKLTDIDRLPITDIKKMKHLIPEKSVLRDRTDIREAIAKSPQPLPMISSHNPGSRQHINSEIVFKGKEIKPDLIYAKIGNEDLTITYRSSTEIRANAPSARTTGALVVGYKGYFTKTPSTLTLKESYRIYGDPVIESVSPSSFIKNDTLTVSGKDLDFSYPLKFTDHSARYIMLANNLSQPYMKQYLLGIDGWTVSADGKTVTFKIKNVSYYGPPLELSNVLTLSGKLRLSKDQWNMDIASPSAVTFGSADTTEFRVTDVRWPWWNTRFIIIPLGRSSYGNKVKITGKGFVCDLNAKIGSLDLGNFTPVDRENVYVTIPYEASSGEITLKRVDDNRTTKTPVLTVISGPKFTPSSENIIKSKFMINLDQTYTLQGWYLKPEGNIPGLSFSLYFVSLSDRDNEYIQLKILSHASQQYQFRVETLQTLPDSWKNDAAFSTSLKQFMWRARYNDKEIYISDPGSYQLVWPYDN